MNRARVTEVMNRARLAPSLIAPPPGIVNRTSVTGISLIAAAAVMVLGCVVESATLPPPLGVAVDGPPPQPMQEIRPSRPNPQAVWIAGYWHWTGVHYAWIPGHWESPPPPTIWRGLRYSAHDGTYFYEPGGWTGR